VPGTPSYEELAAENAALKRVVAELSDRIGALERRLSADSSTSSRPPSSDAPWDRSQRRNVRRGPHRDASLASNRARPRSRAAWWMTPMTRWSS